jgi:predicted nucleic acid-binding protein
MLFDTDVLIWVLRGNPAATAVEGRLSLCTANRKHYQVIADLDIKPFRP